MGLFGAISKAMQNSKEKTRLEAAKFSENVQPKLLQNINDL